MNNSINLFNDVIKTNLLENKNFLYKRLSHIPRFIKLGKKLNNQTKVRGELLASENLTVPPIMILSITNDCNLDCAGCYACAQDRTKDDELTIEDIDRIIGEAIEIGVSIIMIAGGEPLMKSGILETLSRYDDVLFVMFTNGLMLKSETLVKLKKMKNVVSTISLEGSKEVTDTRRGDGVYDAVMDAIARLDDSDMLFGTSITLTCQNYAQVLDREYLLSIQNSGAIATFLIEYVPCQGDIELCLTDEQKADMINRLKTYNEEFDMLIIPLPGDEDKYGGCLAAGRGFLHVSSTGAVEACPFAPYSDTNLKRMPLKQALKSKLLEEVRDNHHLLKEGKGGCTLVNNKEWVSSLAE